MERYINKNTLVEEINKRITDAPINHIGFQRVWAYNDVKEIIDTIEVKEVDFEKLGEIARHLIAVKEHIEDMRLDKEEWLILKKIGYPERFKIHE